MSVPQNERLTECLALPYFLNIPSVTTATLTGAIDLSKSRKALFLFAAGTLASSETITCLLAGCATSGGSYVTIPNSTATLLTAQGNNKGIIIEISAQYLDALGLGYKFIKGSVAGAVGSPVCMVVIAGGGPEEPQYTNVPTSTSILTTLTLT
jgi:hypothetical protein